MVVVDFPSRELDETVLESLWLPASPLPPTGGHVEFDKVCSTTGVKKFCKIWLHVTKVLLTRDI